MINCYLREVENIASNVREMYVLSRKQDDLDEVKNSLSIL